MQQKLASAEEWKAARAKLLDEEKAYTKKVSELAAKRRELPMVQVDNPTEIYFTGADGKKSLLDLFEGRQQLMLYDMMLSDQDTDPCRGCSFILDHIGHVSHLASRETTFAVVARGSIDKIATFKKRMEWKFPMYSTKDTFTDFDRQGEVLTWRPDPEGYFGIAVFWRQGQNVYHTYSTQERGTEVIIPTYALLDMTPLGRQEVGNGLTNFKLHDQY